MVGQRLRDVRRKMSDHNPVGLGCQEPSPPGRKHMQVGTKRSGSRETERGHHELRSSGEGNVGERQETDQGNLSLSKSVGPGVLYPSPLELQRTLPIAFQGRWKECLLGKGEHVPREGSSGQRG